MTVVSATVLNRMRLVEGGSSSARVKEASPPPAASLIETPGFVALEPSSPFESVSLTVVDGVDTLMVRCVLSEECECFRATIAEALGRDKASFWLVCKGRSLRGKWYLGTFGVRDGSVIRCVPRDGTFARGPALPEAARSDAKSKVAMWKDWRDLADDHGDLETAERVVVRGVLAKLIVHQARGEHRAYIARQLLEERMEPPTLKLEDRFGTRQTRLAMTQGPSPPPSPQLSPRSRAIAELAPTITTRRRLPTSKETTRLDSSIYGR